MNNNVLTVVGSVVGLTMMFLFLFIGGMSITDEERKLKKSGTEVDIECKKIREISVENLEEHFKGKGALQGKASLFIEAAKNNGVDPVLLVSISLHETNNGNSPYLTENNNPGRLRKNLEIINFPTLDEGIHYMAEVLSTKFMQQGKWTPESIGPIYHPPNISGYNQKKEWISEVKKHMKNLGGPTLKCQSNHSGEVVENNHDLGNVSSSGFIRPIDKKYKVIKKFSLQDGEVHEGIDYGCGEKASIFATKDGIVEKSMFGDESNGFSNYGNFVYIDHGDGIKTLYAHLNKRLVKESEQVKQGQEIGICGKTGEVSDLSLHYEILINGVKKNPEDYLQ